MRIEIFDDYLTTKVVENSTQDEYILHLTNATGEFVGKIRTEYERLLNDVMEKCFDKDIFKSKQAKEIISYITNKYGDELEYLWPKFPKNAIWRRKDNKKWYAILMVVPKRRLKIDSDDEIEIIDLRANEVEIEELIDNKTIFEGYHMNKKNWITICLNYSVSSKKLFEFIDKSYYIAKKR